MTINVHRAVSVIITRDNFNTVKLIVFNEPFVPGVDLDGREAMERSEIVLFGRRAGADEPIPVTVNTVRDGRIVLSPEDGEKLL